MTYGRGGMVMYFARYWWGGGVRDVFHWSLFSLKVIASGGGGVAHRPPVSQLYNVRLSESLGDIGNKICPILVNLFLQMSSSSFSALIIITIISARVLVAFYFA